MAKRSAQNLSHYRLLTANMGQLVPVACLEVLPGDKFVHSSQAMLRVQTLLAPLMHVVQARIHHWFVPARLVWNDWENFITGKATPTYPTITIPTANHTGLTDHLGIPAVNNIVVNALPIRAYDLIWNEFYRDQDIDTALTIDLTDGADSTTSLALQHVREEKDYFTTARQYPQMGDTGISIPFAAGTNAPIVGLGTVGLTGASNVENNITIRETSGTNNVAPNAVRTDASSKIYMQVDVDSDAARPLVYADMSLVEDGGIDVNDFRRSLARQKFLEHRNRFGSRYTDYLRWLGVRPSDARLQRPEYLGGGRQILSFSEVLATAEGATVNVGDMAGHGIAGLRTRRYRRFFEEHGYVLSLLSVRPKAVYSQQLHRMWMRTTKDDFWQKENEMEGPQGIFHKELYAPAASATSIFGYTGRHDEYRRHPSYVTGDFRTGDVLDHWHLARNFSSQPEINSTFLKNEPRTDIYGSANDAQLYIMVNHNIHARRIISQTARN